ncbi:GyrI-like domain-containing protein [Patulibacter defluvii]|uniref:GyrI-like domain-containing protein n=1 Tax=Patulibacter defluvii TaxID=3095358 RepID=UPI002A749B9D|nr:GyrI-like domain-containing protein [Patulibacter sp. DM4]
MPTPQIETRPDQPYVAIAARATPAGLPAIVDPGFPELFGWLAERGIAPAAAPLIRYRTTGPGELAFELAVPLAAPVAGDERISAGTLPAGRYAVLVHVGPFGGLQASHAELERWTGENGLRLDRRDDRDGLAWGAMVEQYLTDPRSEPDVQRWRTEIAYRLADGD